ncbi:Uncharacterised protein [Bordetella pertussis]|nr:Uncharacterised protein [Bordetella pertussis]
MYAKTKTHHRPTRFAVPLLTAIMVAALAGCGGGGNSSSKRASAPVTPTNPGGPGNPGKSAGRSAAWATR